MSKDIYLQAARRYWTRPDLYAEEILHFTPDPWQRELMNLVATENKISVRSGQGVGKTGTIATIVLWYLATRPYSKVVATAPTMQQLYDVLWAELNKWLSRSKAKKLMTWTKRRIYVTDYPERWWATARTANKPENMQGFHEDYMLFIVDEASGVADNILEAIIGTLTGKENKLVMLGNPTKTSGIFYDSHNRDRDLYSTMKVSARDSARTSKANIEMLERKYGRDSDVVRVRVDGDFPKQQSDSLIRLEVMELASETVLEHYGSYTLDLGVDVARFGDDKTAIAARIGNKVLELTEHKKLDTMETTGSIISAVHRLRDEYPRINHVRIKIDDDGVGAGVVDRLREVVYEENLPWEIIPVKNGAAADEADRYADKITEMYDRLRERLDKNFSNYIQGLPQDLEIPYNDKLITQITNRRYHINSKGKLQVERKEEFKKRIGESPDLSDALLLCFETSGYKDDYILRGGRLYT